MLKSHVVCVLGQRCDVVCYNIVSSTGCALPWVKELRYLGMFIVSARNFWCSLEHARRAHYRLLNAGYGKVGRFTSEEVVLQLVSSKCLPILLYGLEAAHLRISDVRSLDFAVNRFLMKLFQTGNVSIINDCKSYFNFALPSSLLACRQRNSSS